MLDFLDGEVWEKYPDYLILDHGGLGFRLNFDPLYAARMPAVGEKGRLFTHLNVREDELSLYAFPSYEEKQLFELLLTVSRVGPKLAGAVSAALSPTDFALAVLNGDVHRLTSVRGLGRKGAERIILELKDKLQKLSGTAPQVDATAAIPDVAAAVGDVIGETRAALQVLGYRVAEIDAAIQKLLAEQKASDVSTPPTADNWIREALRLLARL